MDDAIKVGARNNRTDKARIQAAHDLTVDLGAECPLFVQRKDAGDALVSFGGEVKALGEGRIGGYMVRFSTADDPDLTGDYFTKDTVLSLPDSIPVFYNHGMDTKIGKRVIGRSTAKVDDIGAWVETQLNMRDEYEKAILALAEAGKLGYSSGALSHLVEREPVKTGVWVIKSWYVGEVSLTPTPAEPRNGVVTLKSLLPSDKAALPIEEVTQTVEIKSVVKEFTMTDELNIKAIVDAALAERDAAVKATEIKAAELKAAEEAGYKKAIEEVKSRGFNPIAYSTQPAGFSEEKDAVPAFKAWMKTGQENQGLIRPGADLAGIKAAFNVTTGASGGYLVPDPLYNQIIAKRALQSWVRQAPTMKFTTSSDHLLVPVEDTASTAFVQTNEAAAYNQNEATIAQVDMALLKYTKLTKVSEEFLAGDNSNFDAWLVDSLARAEAITENTVATTAILASATAGTAAAAATALTIPEVERLIGTLSNGYNVTGASGFLMKNATKYYLKGVNFASAQSWDFDGYPVYVSDDMPAMANNLRSTLFGNFNFFGVLERPGMLVQRNPYLYMANGQVGIFANIYRAYAVLQALAFYTMAQG